MAEFEFGNPEIVEEEVDILIIGGGMAACGCAFEIMRWADGKDLKIKLVDKAAMDRSGAVAQGLSAINTYMGENDPADYVRYVRGDLMGITREDLVYDVGRHVDDSVHNFEEWGLPIWKQAGDEGKMLTEGGKPVRSGRWQIMINGESYKWIVAEAAKKAIGIENITERVFIVRLITDANDPNRVAGAAGFSVRDHKVFIYKFKCCLLVAGGAECVPAEIGWRRYRTRLVSGLERRFNLFDGCRVRCSSDFDGKPFCAGPIQGRLRSGRCLVSAVQG